MPVRQPMMMPAPISTGRYVFSSIGVRTTNHAAMTCPILWATAPAMDVPCTLHRMPFRIRNQITKHPAAPTPIRIANSRICPFSAGRLTTRITSAATARNPMHSAPIPGFLRTASMTARLSAPPARLNQMAESEPKIRPLSTTFVSIRRMQLGQSMR